MCACRPSQRIRCVAWSGCLCVASFPFPLDRSIHFSPLLLSHSAMSMSMPNRIRSIQAAFPYSIRSVITRPIVFHRSLVQPQSTHIAAAPIHCSTGIHTTTRHRATKNNHSHNMSADCQHHDSTPMRDGRLVPDEPYTLKGVGQTMEPNADAVKIAKVGTNSADGHSRHRQGAEQERS